jgi:dTDP-glucose 4,6-dehydratase
VVRVLITGAAGFIGHHLVAAILKRTDWRITIIDRLDCSGNLNRLAEIGAAKNPRVRFVYHDLRASTNDQLAAQIGAHDYILHLAAGTHVDRSIECPMEFVLDNVVATCNILDFARLTGCEKFLNFSTDEVFGPAPEGVAYGEDDRYNAGNPYAATKAGAAQLGVAYHNTYKLPVITTHTMNVIGTRQHPEKYVPGTIAKIRDGEIVTIHSTPDLEHAGSRFYIDAAAVADAVLFLLKNGTPGEKYNIVGELELGNLSLASKIAEIMQRDLRYVMMDAHSQRPGHDLRYALSDEKLKSMGWKQPQTFDDALHGIVEWTLKNPNWLDMPKLQKPNAFGGQVERQRSYRQSSEKLVRHLRGASRAGINTQLGGAGAMLVNGMAM